jgi:hypothetical protein
MLYWLGRQTSNDACRNPVALLHLKSQQNRVQLLTLCDEVSHPSNANLAALSMIAMLGQECLLADR